MATQRFSNWWFMALNGLVFAIFGILILFFTQEAIKTLLLYFGFVMLAAGGLVLIVGINRLRRDKPAAMLLVEAIATIGAGIALGFFPQFSLSLFLILIGIWAILIGIIQLVIIINIKGSYASANRNLMMINGLLTIALGISLLFNPFQWAIFLVKVIGALAALFGIILIYFAFTLRSVKE